MVDDPYKRFLKNRGLDYPSREKLDLPYKIVLEKKLVPGGSLVFGVNQEDGRHLHMMPEELAYGLHIPGRPGMGKSTAGQLIGTQIIDRIADRADESFIVIDPHGPVAAHLLRYCIKKDIDPSRVLYVDLTRRGGVVPVINPLRPDAFFPSDPQRGVPLVAYCLLEALTRAFGLQFAMEQPQIAETMITAAAAIAANGYSFAETRFFVQNTPENIRARETFLEKVADPTIIDHWRELHKPENKRELRTETAGAARRFNYILRSDTLRLMFGQTTPGVDFAQLLEKGTIAIFNLALHETDVTDQGQRFLGALLLNQINAAVRRRKKNAASPCYVFIDEFARFASFDTMEALAEARGFGMRLILAHQRLDQLLLQDQDPRLMKAVLAIPNKLIFAMGLVEEQLELARQAYGPWVDLHKRKLELYSKVFKPYLTRVAVPTESEAMGESETDVVIDQEAEQRGAGSAAGRGEGLITPPGGGMFVGADPTSTEHVQHVDSTFGALMRGRAWASGTGRHRIAGKSVSYPFVTDYEELEQLSHVEFQSFDEQVIAEMQRATRQGVGDATFMHGHREPPLAGRTPEYQPIELPQGAERSYLQSTMKAHPGHFMAVTDADRSIKHRSKQILASVEPPSDSEPEMPHWGKTKKKPKKKKRTSTGLNPLRSPPSESK